MSVELARVRLRGLYAVAAAIILVIGLPVYQAVFLSPTGYTTAIQAIPQQGTFAPYLAWLAAHGAENRTYRLIQIVAFILAATLPSQLRRVLWPANPREGRLPALLGFIGFALFVVALVLGLFSSTGAASAYAAAGDAAQQASAARGYATSYALETLLSRVFGGALVTIALVLCALRMRQEHALPAWLAYVTLVVAALTAATALLSAFTPASPSVATSSLSLIALALWLGVVGVLLARLRSLSPDAAPPASES